MCLLSLGSVFLLAAATASDIVQVTESSYKQFAKDNEAFVISFTAPWCGHSRALKPEYEKLAAQLKREGLPVAHVDSTENEALATKLDIKGYPTVLFLRGGLKLEYDGERRVADLKAWALKKLRPSLPTLATEELASFARGKIALVLFNSGGQDSEAYRAMLAVAAAIEQPCAVSSATGGLDVPAGAPALVMYKTFDGGAPAVLSGATEELTRARMQQFAQVESLPLVTEYSAQNEDALFAGPVGLHVLLFFSGAKPELAEATAAAKSLRGDAVFSLVDAAKFGEVAEFFDVAPKGSLQPPVALAFALDESTKYAHAGPLEAVSLIAFVRSVQAKTATPHLRSQPELAQAGPVVELVGSTYAGAVGDAAKDVLVQLYSPECGHCRKLAPVYEAVARKFAADGEMVVAKMDATRNDIAGLEPEGYPTILFFPRGNKKGVEYDGSRDEHDLVQFVADVREGRQHIGGLPDFEAADEEAAKVEL